MGGCAHYCTQALSVSVLVSGEDVWQRFPTGERDDSHPSYRKKIGASVSIFTPTASSERLRQARA